MSNETDNKELNTASTTPKYIDLISKSKEQMEREQLDLFVEESRQNIDADILATKKEIAKVTRALQDRKAKMPLDPKAVLEVKQELIELQAGLAELEALKTELF